MLDIASQIEELVHENLVSIEHQALINETIFQLEFADKSCWCFGIKTKQLSKNNMQIHGNLKLIK